MHETIVSGLINKYGLTVDAQLGADGPFDVVVDPKNSAGTITWCGSALYPSVILPIRHPPYPALS